MLGGYMSLAEKIIVKVKSLPEDKQSEILDFIDFLSKKMNDEERKQWSKFSLESAMRGLESEESLYSLEDIKEKY
jgi:formylmethanofuran dehydrogenase subunit E